MPSEVIPGIRLFHILLEHETLERNGLKLAALSICQTHLASHLSIAVSLSLSLQFPNRRFKMHYKQQAAFHIFQ